MGKRRRNASPCSSRSTKPESTGIVGRCAGTLFSWLSQFLPPTLLQLQPSARVGSITGIVPPRLSSASLSLTLPQDLASLVSKDHNAPHQPSSTETDECCTVSLLALFPALVRRMMSVYSYFLDPLLRVVYVVLGLVLRFSGGESRLTLSCGDRGDEDGRALVLVATDVRVAGASIEIGSVRLIASSVARDGNDKVLKSEDDDDDDDDDDGAGCCAPQLTNLLEVAHVRAVLRVFTRRAVVRTSVGDVEIDINCEMLSDWQQHLYDRIPLHSEHDDDDLDSIVMQHAEAPAAEEGGISIPSEPQPSLSKAQELKPGDSHNALPFKIEAGVFVSFAAVTIRMKESYPIARVEVVKAKPHCQLKCTDTSTSSGIQSRAQDIRLSLSLLNMRVVDLTAPSSSTSAPPCDLLHLDETVELALSVTIPADIPCEKPKVVLYSTVNRLGIAIPDTGSGLPQAIKALEKALQSSEMQQKREQIEALLMPKIPPSLSLDLDIRAQVNDTRIQKRSLAICIPDVALKLSSRPQALGGNSNKLCAEVTVHVASIIHGDQDEHPLNVLDKPARLEVFSELDVTLKEQDGGKIDCTWNAEIHGVLTEVCLLGAMDPQQPTRPKSLFPYAEITGHVSSHMEIVITLSIPRSVLLKSLCVLLSRVPLVGLSIKHA